MAEEIELKLTVSPKELGRIGRDPLVRAFAIRRGSSRQLRSTYFDTPERTLKNQGIALRVRRVGDRWIQTLKLAHNGSASLFRRQEYEMPVSEEKPELDRFQDAGLRKIFAKDKLASGLQPVFTTDFHRRSVPMKLGDSEMELVLDEGEISAGEVRIPICEAEVELISGRPEQIYAFALALHKRVPFRLETSSKAARGYGLLAPSKPQPARARAFDLDPKMSVAQVFTEAARNCLEQIRANEVAILKGDGALEGVHQFRVGVRRLRALLSAFRTGVSAPPLVYLRSELAWLQGAFGPAREWDVFAAETLRPLRDRLPRESGLDAMADAAEAARRAAYDSLDSVLTGRRYTALLLNLEMWLESGSGLPKAAGSKGHPLSQPIGPFAAKVLNQRWDKLAKAARKRHSLSEPELHAVRILAKKLRYPAEFFQSLYPKAASKSYLKTLTALQDTLGSLNDAVVGEGLLDQLAVRMSAAPAEAGEDQRAQGLVRGWQAACIERDLVHFADAWSRLAQTKPFWT